MSTLNLQVAASADDGYVYGTTGGSPSTFISDSSSAMTVGCLGGFNRSYDNWHRFTGVSGLSGATVNTATLSLYGSLVDDGTPETRIAAVDATAPAAPTDVTEFNAFTPTTAAVTWDNLDLTADSFNASPDISTIIQELADSYDPSVIEILHFDDKETNATNRSRPSAYDVDAAQAAKLDIDFTAGGGGGGKPHYYYAQQ